MFVPRAVRKRPPPSSLSPSLVEPPNSSFQTLNSPVLPLPTHLVERTGNGFLSGSVAPSPTISLLSQSVSSPHSSPTLQISPSSRSGGACCATPIAVAPVPGNPVLVSSVVHESASAPTSGGDNASSADLPGGDPLEDEGDFSEADELLLFGGLFLCRERVKKRCLLSAGSQSTPENPVKLRSVDQRAAEPNEPTCAVCGRYGEYICDETDDDVCSVECKAVVLKRVPDSTRSDESTQKADDPRQNPKVVLHHKDSLPCMQDEVVEIVVRDGVKSLPEWEPDRVIKRLTQQQVDDLRTQIEISVQGDEVPRPILEFSNCKFLPKLQSNLDITGYEIPTPVQMQLIPAVLKCRDMLVSAGTGSGKTVGYLLSIVFRICRIRSHYQLEARKPLAIVLTPTRELCVQVEQQAKDLAKGLQFKTALVVGGDAMPQQLYRINQGVELIVGTPGRLIDLLAKHEVELDNVCMLVLDEVDCMLERGFRDQVLQIQTALTQPQILMFSATIPPGIEKLSTSMLRRPLLISVGKSSSPSEAVKQTVMWVESKQKKKKLFDIIRSPQHFHPPVVVFVNSRAGADLLAEAIQSVTGLQAAAIHGEKPMQERRQVLKDFLTGSLPIVVATGVLGRGLDLLRVTQVIIFDMPHSTQEYIHQIGRASRLGVPGSAMVFINDDSKVLFKDLVELFQKSGVVVPKELVNSPYAASSYAAAYNPRKRKTYRKDQRVVK